MTSADRPGDPNPPGSSSAPSPIESLTDAMLTEERLIEELILVMRRQRAAIDRDDLEVVADSVFATHRVLVTLAEARRRRRTLNTLIGQHEGLAIHALDDALGSRMTPDLRAARDALCGAARLLSREVALNRTLLRAARARGDACARAHAVGRAPTPQRQPSITGPRRAAP